MNRKNAKTSWAKRGAALLLMLALLGPMAGCSAGAAKSKGAAALSGSAKSAAAAPQSGAKPAQGGPIPIKFGETYSNDVITLSVLAVNRYEKVEPKNKDSFYMYLSDVAGEQFVVFDCLAKNISRDAVTLRAFVPELTIDGYHYSGQLYEENQTGVSKLIYAIKPLVTQKFYIIASVPDSLASQGGTLKIGVNREISSYYSRKIDGMDVIYTLDYAAPH